MDWYLSINIERRRDVIELPIDDVLDVSGWDLRKALHLLWKGNPPLMEWLASPIVYRESSSVAAQMRDLKSRHYSVGACLHHYWRMARQNHGGNPEEPTVRIKKYFYVLRPLLAIKWIDQGLGIVPTEFQKLVEGVVDLTELKEEIERLVAFKREGQEQDRVPRITAISDFIKTELARHEQRRFERRDRNAMGPVEEFNRVFRAALDEVWLQEEDSGILLAR